MAAGMLPRGISSPAATIQAQSPPSEKRQEQTRHSPRGSKGKQQSDQTLQTSVSNRCLRPEFQAADRGRGDVYIQHFKSVPVTHRNTNIFLAECRHIKITCGTAATFDFCCVVNINY